MSVCNGTMWQMCPVLFGEATSSQQCSVLFNLYQKHRFVNGYEFILNCPAPCNTNNVIYALTCQCNNYDYIGETSSNLLTRLSSHQCFTHCLILETLVGEKNYMQFWGGKMKEMSKKDTMRLYQHPMGFSTVIQLFLNINTNYWIFVPMSNEEADQENVRYQAVSTLPTTHTRNDRNMQKCIDAMPRPPEDYKFSKFQINKQYEFFAMKHYLKQPDQNYIVYTATVIAVLPLNTSDLFRRIIH